MKWFDALRANLKTKKRSQAESASGDRAGAGPAFDAASHAGSDDLVPPPLAPSLGLGGSSFGTASGDAEVDVDADPHPKRRSMSIDLYAPPYRPGFGRPSVDRRASLEQWQEARRQRNSVDLGQQQQQGTISTDRLTICKAAGTTIVNGTYVTVKHLGSGTFGRVMLCLNLQDQRLYAVKFCRKSSFASPPSAAARHGAAGRLRRGGSAGAGFGLAASASGPLPPLCPHPGGGGAVAGRLALSSCDERVDGLMSGSSCGGSNPGSGTLVLPPRSSFDGGAAAAAAGAARPRQYQAQQQQQQQQLVAAFGTAFGGAFAAAPGGFAGGALGRGLGGGGFVGAGAPPPPQPPPFAGDEASLSDVAGLRDGSGTSASAPGPLDSGASAPAAAAAAAGPGPGPGPGLGSQGAPPAASAPPPGAPAAARGGLATEEAVREIAILKKLSHPNIVNLVEVIDDPASDGLLLVMEYVEGGTLQPRAVGPGRWAPMPEGLAWKYVRQVLQGLDYLHANRVVHGDLKPANLLLDSNTRRIKIADFGSSFSPSAAGPAGLGAGAAVSAGAGRAGASGSFSTPAFRSPESLAAGYQPSFEMDLWALGVCIYMWCFGALPYAGGTPAAIYERIKCQELPLPRACDAELGGDDAMAPSEELMDFVRQLLCKDPAARPDVTAAMRHPWVTQAGAASLPSLCAGDAAARPESRPRPSRDEIEAAVRLADAPIRERVESVFTERLYRDGEVLIAPGDAADTVYLIAEGRVEIVAPPLLGGAAAAAAEPMISGMADLDSFDIGGAAAAAGSMGCVPACSRGAMEAAFAFAAAGQPAWNDAAATLAVKGPGDSLGLPSLLQSEAEGGEHRWRAFCRARGEVTVFAARAADLRALAARDPEIEPAVAQISTQQETDMAVAEALRRLRLYGGGCSGGGGGAVVAGAAAGAAGVYAGQ
ncbi:calcium calmodulin-dependent kinase [Raphidocelis subcapitata]|uniref:Calcium calmodulin-dependent kinase n=1 Tax=Raphidocelis subcapitata TaxID=307507 RepID=A0A2V0PEC3_9CHLO|nr:calcium calmodulin-dependent kinase [Raphidocelis subcapitata]|eukprot:GBF96243.1 calcium calmodulin-dependent kinase [Raphidocelis subcapitata]